MTTAPVFIVLTAEGLTLARRLAPLVSASVHGLTGRIDGADATFDDTLAHVRSLFVSGRPVIGVCAAGIVIRAVASALGDKREEPPLLAVAEDGSAVVPLLGGHRGANALAARLAEALAIAPALTTAGDVRFGIALDAPPPGWRLANPQDAKPFTASLLAGSTVRLDGEAAWLNAASLPVADDGELQIIVGDADVSGDAGRLVFCPQTIAVGVGCERGTAADEVITLIEEGLQAAGLNAAAVALLVSIDLKMDEPALHSAARHFGVPLRFFAAAELERETPRLVNPSETVFRAVGCHGVAEGAALAAAGQAGVLVLPKRKSARATCAIARSAAPIDGPNTGRPQGRLAVVGLGPGSTEWLSAEAAALVAEAGDLVGYSGYLDLVPVRPGQMRHGFALGEEAKRVAHALDLAAAGRQVALICSGDPGIYAMATLVYESLADAGRGDWGRVDIVVAPGISAMQAAAARAGAPLGHDFCAISLSDLLTPWTAIRRRVEAAAAGDFVIAFYNPVSRRRRHQLAEAREVLLQQRGAATPVVLARNLGRADEALRVTNLGDLDPETVDMLTVVLVGASTTRTLPRGDGSIAVYTPRGYGVGSGEAKAS